MSSPRSSGRPRAGPKKLQFEHLEYNPIYGSHESLPHTNARVNPIPSEAPNSYGTEIKKFLLENAMKFIAHVKQLEKSVKECYTPDDVKDLNVRHLTILHQIWDRMPRMADCDRPLTDEERAEWQDSAEAKKAKKLMEDANSRLDAINQYIATTKNFGYHEHYAQIDEFLRIRQEQLEKNRKLIAFATPFFAQEESLKSIEERKAGIEPWIKDWNDHLAGLKAHLVLLRRDISIPKLKKLIEDTHPTMARLSTAESKITGTFDIMSIVVSQNPTKIIWTPTALDTLRKLTVFFARQFVIKQGMVAEYNQAQQKSDDSACFLCLGQFRDSTGLVECGHVFCFECVVGFVSKRLHCPVCRKGATFVDLRRFQVVA